METFCETVQFYLRHLEDSVYPVMTEDQFALKLFPMYRYFVTVWLRNNTPEGFLYRVLGFPPATGLEADKVGVLLLERLYKTDHGDDFDREVRQYRKLLLEKCVSSLRGPGVSTSVTSEGLEFLAKGLVELRGGDLGSAFNAISEQCRAFFDNMEGSVRAEVASDTLVALSRNHFSLVMYELQHHLKPLNLTEESVLVTLAKLANGN
ncbi:unnamed protein product, partial [Rangifer tarandus platyrhynchus]